MASTYTTNLNVEKPGIGEQDGTWGGTVNTDFDLYDEAINGIAIVTLAAAGSSGSPNIETITQGASADARSPYIQFTDGGDLGADVYVQLAPDTAEKIAYIYNNLSGSQDLYLFQGTWDAARDYVLAAGKTALLKFSGEGAGSSTVTEVMGDMQFNGGLDLGDISITGTTISTTGGTDLNLTPLAGQQLVLDGTVIVDAGVVTGITALTTDDFTVQNSQYIQEAAAGQADIAGYGQIWVQNDAPNTLWFKDDAGTSYQLGLGVDLDIRVVVCNDLLTTQDTFYLGVYSGVVEPALVFDDTGANKDAIYYNRVGDSMNFVIANVNNFSIKASEITVSQDLSIRDEIFNWASNQIVRWSAGNAAGVGANINLHGSTETDAYDVEFKSDSTTELHFDASANLWDFQGNDLTTGGDVTFDVAGKGVDFSAETSSSATGASVDSKVLVKYEAGTYTPTLVCSSSGSYTIGGGQTTLAYTVIGRTCHVQGRLQITGESSPSGSLRLELPFAVDALTESADTFYTPFTIWNDGGTLVRPTVLGLVGGNSYATLYQTPSVDPEVIDEGDVDTAFFVAVEFTYIIDN